MWWPPACTRVVHRRHIDRTRRRMSNMLMCFALLLAITHFCFFCGWFFLGLQFLATTKHSLSDQMVRDQSRSVHLRWRLPQASRAAIWLCIRACLWAGHLQFNPFLPNFRWYILFFNIQSTCGTPILLATSSESSLITILTQKKCYINSKLLWSRDTIKCDFWFSTCASKILNLSRIV